MPTSSQNSTCDPNIETNQIHPLGYRLRKDRCEGIYNQRKSSSALAISSFIRPTESIDLSPSQELAIDWVAPRADQVKIRIDSLRPRLYYRMDTVQSASKGSYAWSIAIVTALNLTMKDLGFLGMAQQNIGQVRREVYLPLIIHPEGRKDPLRPPEVTVVPGIDASEIYLSVAPVDEDGKLRSFLIYDQPLKRSYYPAGRPVRISLPSVKQQGLYFLNIGADLADGKSTPLEVYFYNSGS